jgi:small subunit ribosomal protein S1
VVGAVLDGTVVNLAPYGVFVDVDWASGLVHRTELPATPHPWSEATIDRGMRIRVRVLTVRDDGFLALSCKDL